METQGDATLRASASIPRGRKEEQGVFRRSRYFTSQGLFPCFPNPAPDLPMPKSLVHEGGNASEIIQRRSLSVRA